MGTTDDRNDPGLRKIEPDGMQEKYLVLSEEERAKGFVRPLRQSYRHVGRPGPANPLLELTAKQREIYGDRYAKFEKYPESREPVLGHFWTQNDLNRIDHGCGTVTTMGPTIAETYARDPSFYGATFCAGCHAHFPVGDEGEFVWDGTDERVGT